MAVLRLNIDFTAMPHLTFVPLFIGAKIWRIDKSETQFKMDRPMRDQYRNGEVILNSY